MDNYIYSYYQAITDGSIVVGKWIKLFYQRVIDGLQNKSFTFDIKKADNAIRFVERYCHHSEGRSDRITLELWQKAFLSVVFGVLDENGNRQFREVVLIIGRKNGKTLFASAIIAYCLYADGEYGAKVFCVAPKLDQADLVYQAFWQTVKSEAALAKRTKSRKSDFYVADTNSSVKKIAFNARKSDGFNPSLTVCDEISSWPAEMGLKQYEVMKSALGARRQPLLLSISTSGYINEGIFDELMKRSTRYLLGDSNERRLAPFLYIIDDVAKWSDINELRKSNPNLGVSVSVDYMLEEIAIAEGSLSKRSEFLCKYCNVKQNSSVAWLPTEAVERCCGNPLKLEDYQNTYCVAGVDLSRTTDLTAAVAVIEKDGRLNVFAQFWLPAERLDDAIALDGVPYRAYLQRGLLRLSGDNFIDYHDVEQWFRELVEKYQIYPLKVGYDRYSAQYLIQDLQQYGFNVDDIFQGNNLTPVIRETDGLIRDGVINIGDNDLLKIHLLNTALKVDAETDRCKIVKLQKNGHIDGCAALLDALTVRQKWYGEIGEQLRNEG